MVISNTISVARLNLIDGCLPLEVCCAFQTRVEPMDLEGLWLCPLHARRPPDAPKVPPPSFLVELPAQSDI